MKKAKVLNLFADDSCTSNPKNTLDLISFQMSAQGIIRNDYTIKFDSPSWANQDLKFDQFNFCLNILTPPGSKFACRLVYVGQRITDDVCRKNFQVTNINSFANVCWIQFLNRTKSKLGRIYCSVRYVP